jgi:hypothetical protein
MFIVGVVRLVDWSLRSRDSTRPLTGSGRSRWKVRMMDSFCTLLQVLSYSTSPAQLSYQ